MTDLERSHAELRAAVILARKEIRKLNFGKRDTPVLQKLRRVLRDARTVARSAVKLKGWREATMEVVAEPRTRM